MKTGQQIIGLIVCLVVSFIPGWVGSRFVPGGWYAALDKPTWTPPGWIFGPVWTLLYIMMGVAAWLVWKRNGFSAAKAALLIFIGQLVLNGLWSWLFFGLHRPGLAFVDIIALWMMIILTIIAFWRQAVPAGVLLLPYLAWVSFASALNFSIWHLNRGM